MVVAEGVKEKVKYAVERPAGKWSGGDGSCKLCVCAKCLPRMSCYLLWSLTCMGSISGSCASGFWFSSVNKDPRQQIGKKETSVFL